MTDRTPGAGSAPTARQALLLPLASITICLSAACPCYLRGHLQLAPVVECVHTLSSIHNCSLPWSLAARSGGTTEDPQKPLRPQWSPCSTHQLSKLWTPAAWSEEISHFPEPGATPRPILTPCTSRPRVLAYTSMVPQQVDVFPHQSQSGRKDCFSKYPAPPQGCRAMYRHPIHQQWSTCSQVHTKHSPQQILF